MEQKIIELVNLYDVEISDTPGCKIVENGVERLATKNDVDKIFGFDKQEDPLSPAKGIINGLKISIPIWIVIGLLAWWMTVLYFNGTLNGGK